MASRRARADSVFIDMENVEMSRPLPPPLVRRVWLSLLPRNRREIRPWILLKTIEVIEETGAVVVEGVLVTYSGSAVQGQGGDIRIVLSSLAEYNELVKLEPKLHLDPVSILAISREAKRSGVHLYQLTDDPQRPTVSRFYEPATERYFDFGHAVAPACSRLFRAL